jgi:alpha-tubulin suppressor-like RCC1 family protein
LAVAPGACGDDDAQNNPGDDNDDADNGDQNDDGDDNGDQGTEADASTPQPDASQVDASPPDAGEPPPDGGEPPPDAARPPPDAAPPPDAPPPDAAPPDAAPPDAAVTTVVSLGAGNNNVCAVLSTGIVRCWGRNEQGQIGIGSVSGPVTRPTNVNGLTDGTWVDCGAATCCAATSAGRAQCWGWNDQGILGVNQTSTQLGNRPTAAPVLALPNGGTIGELTGVDEVTLGAAHACVRRGGEVWCWGWNAAGQCGRPNGAGGEGTILLAKPSVVTGIEALSVNAQGSEFTCGVDSGGLVQCWGLDFQGQLGDGTAGGLRSTPAPVTGITQASAVAVGFQHACAIGRTVADGVGVYCWGLNDFGQLGPNGPTAAPLTTATPVLVPGLGTAVAVIAGQSHSCAMLANGVIRCWGANNFGQLGDGTFSSRSAPANVTGTGGSGSLSPATHIATGFGHTCAVLSNRSVYCWGANAFGQLGQGATGANSSLPVEVPVIPDGG